MVRWYFVGLALSFFGTTAMHLVAGIWVKTLTGSDRLAALAVLCVYAPSLLAPVLGYLADKVRRRTLLIWTDLAMALVLASLFLVRGPEQVWLVFAVMTVYGVKAVLTSAAEPALLVALLPPDKLAKVNGLRMSLQEGMKLVAPLAAAALFVSSGAGPVVALDLLTFVLAAAATSMIKIQEPPPQPRKGGGLKHLGKLTIPLLGGAVAMLAAGLHSAAVYPLVEDGLHQAPAFLGVLGAVQGAGSLLAGLRPMSLTWGLVLISAAAALRVTGWLPAVLTASALHGVGLAWAVIAVLTTVQLSTPPDLMGRVSATATSVVFAGTPFGLAAGAWLVGVTSFQAIYVGIGVLTLAAALRARGGQARRFTAREAPAWRD